MSILKPQSTENGFVIRQVFASFRNKDFTLANLAWITVAT